LTIRSDSGVTLTVEPSNWLTDGLFVMLEGNSEHFPADDARKLAEWLAARFPTPATPVLEPGKVYRLLPGAKTASGGDVYFADDVTRVKVESGPDGDGDYVVRNVDGSGTTYGGGDTYGPTDTQYVAREYLGDPEPEAPALKAGDRIDEAALSTLTGAPALSARIIDEAHTFATTTADEPLNSTRVAAVEKALELLFTQADDVTIDDILSVAAYVAGEIDIVHDDEADA